MSKIYIDDNAFDGTKELSFRDINNIIRCSRDIETNIQITFIKKYYKIHNLLHQCNLFPTELENIICNYINDIFFMNCEIDATYNNNTYLLFDIPYIGNKVIKKNHTENGYINYCRYDFAFEIAIIRSKNKFAYYLNNVYGNAIDTINRSNDNQELDVIQLINVYLRSLNKNSIATSKNFETNITIDSCIYKKNLIASVYTEHNRKKMYGIQIKNHKQFQNIIAIIHCTINKLIKKLNNI